MLVLGSIGGFFIQLGISLLLAIIFAGVTFMFMMFTVGIFGAEGGFFTVMATICCFIIPIIIFIVVFFSSMTTDYGY